MINLSELLQLVFLCLFGYLVYLVHKAVDLYEHKNYTDYKSYKQAIKETNSSVFKPNRPRDEQGVHRIKGDRLKVTVKKSNGLAETQDALVNLSQADPEAVMNSIDEFGKVKG